MMSEPSASSSGASASKTYARLLGYFLPHWKVLLLAIVCNAAYGFIDTEFIKAFKPLLDEGLFERNTDYLIIAPVFVVIVLILRGLTGFVAAYCMAWVGNNMIMELRKQIFSRYLMLPAKFFDTHKTGDLLSKVIYNTEQLNKSTTDAITTIIRNVAIIGFALWGMIAESWQLTLLFLITTPLIAFLVAVTSRRFRIISRRIQTAMGDITHVTQEGIEAYQEIKVYAGQEYEEANFARVNSRNRQQSMKMEVTKALSVPIIQLLAGLGLALVLHFAIAGVLADEISPGGFVSMIMLMMLILKPLKSLSSVNVIIQRGIAAAESIFDVLDQPTEVDKGTLSLERSAGKISFCNINFQYPSSDRPALKNISFDLPPGKTIAIVGRSGSGKSTLLSLLMRFYDIDSGTILLDGRSINEYRLKDYRKQISYVSQHVTLFNDSIAHNIAYGILAETSEEEIILAAKKAHAWEFISELPEGLNTMIGERGMLLSGGQRQRLSIARAILKDAPIMILDEATSALDSESENFIQQAMNAVMNNRTTIVVAHRLSTIENADIIIVMEQGEIRESGNHQELLQQAGIYAGLHQMQFKD